MGVIKKQCSKCGEIKELACFPRNKNGLHGHKSVCKCCAKVYYQKNRDSILKQKKIYAVENRGRIQKYRREYYLDNREKLIRDAILREKHKMACSPEFRIAKNLRDRVRKALKRNKGIRAGSAIRDLGCSVGELRAYLESLFLPRMTWENYGSKWHIDHIRPLCTFRLTHKDDFSKACHYTNLRPLYAKDNLRRPKRGLLKEKKSDGIIRN